jgi:hypothetical protein
VRRICLLDAPAVLPTEVRRELAQRFGLGLVLASLNALAAAERLAVGPVDALAPVLLAALHEAAIELADGRNDDDVHQMIDDLITALLR